MLLAIDIGNTNVTLGLFKAGVLTATRRAATHARASADELELLLDGLLRLDDASFADVSAIACASVVPNLDGRGRSDRRAPRAPARRRIGRHRAARDPDRPSARRSARTGSSTPWPPRGSTGRRPSSSTSGRRRRSTASRLTERTSAGRSRPVSSSAWRRSPRGRPSCRGSSSERRIGRSAATRSARCNRARSSATRHLPTGLLVAGPARARRRRRHRAGRRQGDPDRWPLGRSVGTKPRRDRRDRPGPDPQGPRDPPRRGERRRAARARAAPDR